jgi:hypothetical protein
MHERCMGASYYSYLVNLSVFSVFFVSVHSVLS